MNTAIRSRPISAISRSRWRLREQPRSSAPTHMWSNLGSGSATNAVAGHWWSTQPAILFPVKAALAGALALSYGSSCAKPPSRNLNIGSKPSLQVARTGWVPLLMTRTANGPEVHAVSSETNASSNEAVALLARHLPPSGVQYQLACLAEAQPLPRLQ